MFKTLSHLRTQLVSRRVGALCVAATQYASYSTDDPGVQYLKRHRKRKLAYRTIHGDSPGVVYCGAYQRTMHCHRSRAIEDYCRENKLNCVRFDYEGVGESDGDMKTVTFDTWKENVLAVVDQLTTGPQILVGSGIGAWLASHAAMERPYRIHSLVSVGGAFDLKQKVFTDFSEEQLEALEKDGHMKRAVPIGEFFVSKSFIDSAKENFILSDGHEMKEDGVEQELLPISCPVRIIHGLADQEISAEIAVQLGDVVESEDVRLVLSKTTDHLFSRPECIQLIFEEISRLINPSEEAKSLSVVDWGRMSKYAQSGKLLKATTTN